MTTKTKKPATSKVKFNYKTIKTFNDACAKLSLDPAQLPDTSMIPEEFSKPIIAGYKLMIIFKAINDGWTPDWSNNQYKYYPWYWVLSSGFGFSGSNFSSARTFTRVGSHLCTDSSDKAQFIADQFIAEYQEYLLYSE